MKAEAAAAPVSSLHLTELVVRTDDGTATEEDVSVAAGAREREQGRHLLAATKVVPSRDRGPRRQRHDRGLLAAPTPVPRRDRLRELGGDAQRALRAGAPRPGEARRRRPRRRAGAGAGRARCSSATLAGGARVGRAPRPAAARRTRPVTCRSAVSGPTTRARAELIERRHLTPGYDPEADPAYADVIERVLAGERELK